MPYIRISLMQPRQEHRTTLEALQESLLAGFKALPGYLDGYLMQTTDGTGVLAG